MAYFLFLDESGHDHRESPYEVLAGICIKDENLWHITRLMRDYEFECFNCRYTLFNQREIKARSFLNNKTFRLANQLPAMHEDERTALAYEALHQSGNITKKQLTALAQAKLAYVEKVLMSCNAFRCKTFASIISDPLSIPHYETYLRKDYIFLFERFYYFLEDQNMKLGFMVFDELDKSASHLFSNQMEKYFRRTWKGVVRSNLIMPEPFFVHSELSTVVQIPDFIAYILSWNFRNTTLIKEKRAELDKYMRMIISLRYNTKRFIEEEGGEEAEYIINSIMVIK